MPYLLSGGMITGTAIYVVVNTAISYSVLAADDIIFADGTIDIDLLPVASTLNKPLTIINVGSGTVSVTPDGAETINGAAGAYDETAQYEAVTLFPNKSAGEWQIISKL